jgi:hypothetical protein
MKGGDIMTITWINGVKYFIDQFGVVHSTNPLSAS